MNERTHPKWIGLVEWAEPGEPHSPQYMWAGSENSAVLLFHGKLSPDHLCACAAVYACAHVFAERHFLAKRHIVQNNEKKKVWLDIS